MLNNLLVYSMAVYINELVTLSPIVLLSNGHESKSFIELEMM